MRFRRCAPGVRRATRFLADQRGAAAPLIALVFPVMVGGVALGTEAGYWFLTQRQLQQAADLAAHAAAVAKRSGATETQMEEAGLRVARGSGFEDATDTLDVYTPPETTDYSQPEEAVEIRIVRQQERYFTRIYADETVAISARAVAAVEAGVSACLLALSTSAPRAVTVAGSSNVSFQNCDVASNSVAPDSFYMSGNSVVSTGCVNTVGGAQTTAGLTLTDCATPNENAPVVADPYSSIEEPLIPGGTSCAPDSTVDNETVTPTETHASGVKAMRFCNGLSVSGDVTFGPGLYIIEAGSAGGGAFKVAGGAVVTTDPNAPDPGVTFYLADGVELDFSGTPTLNLTAPTSGPYAGLLVFGSRTSTTVQHSIRGTAGSTLNGAIYTPASNVDLNGDFTGSSGSGCTQIVSSTVTFSGNATLEVDCTAIGTRPIIARQKVRLVE